MLHAWLVGTSAAIIFFLGMLHLVLTYRGNKFWPRDAALKTTLESAKIYLTPQTSFWKAWICFNATHSLGAMVFGIVYGYLSLYGTTFFFQSYFLIGLGAATFASYAFLVGCTGFSTPFRGVMLAGGFYTAGILVFLLRLT